MCLHSVSYCGFWPAQRYGGLGFDGVMLVAKRPHVSPLDYDGKDRKKLRKKIEDLGLKLVCLAGYTDFTAGVDKPGIPISGDPSLLRGPRCKAGPRPGNRQGKDLHKAMSIVGMSCHCECPVKQKKSRWLRAIS